MSRGDKKALLMAFLEKKPAKLITKNEVLKVCKFEELNYARTLLWRLNKDGVIHQHIDLNDDGDRQYALKIRKDKIKPYSPVESSRRKKKTLSSIMGEKEIRAHFAVVFKVMNDLEDKLVAQANEVKEQNQKLSKAKRAMREID